MIAKYLLIFVLTVETNGFLSSGKSSDFGGSYPDINDPKINLDFFIRTIGSKDPNVSSVNYINGSIFAKQPGKQLQKLFNFEGYNINRKLYQANGSCISLSREYVVYRDPRTHVIQSVWMNPWSLKPNEVFYVANDPVNALLNLGDIVPTKPLPDGGVVFNTDVLLEYPNALDPVNYPQYSAGPVYEAAELFGFFANLTRLAYDRKLSVPMVGTWIRRSQYLPWMAMSTSKGELYYTTFSWKCKDQGLNCVADDIMEIISGQFPKYKEAPTVEEIPNETSWTVFKETIDRRRKAGLPDIVIPTSNVSLNLSTYNATVDQRIVDFFQKEKSIPVYFNGTAWSQITGKQSVNLFNIEGNVLVSISQTAKDIGLYTVSLTGTLLYLDTQTGKPITFWSNPLTGDTIFVKNPVTFKDKELDFPRDFVYSMDIASSNVIGLLAAQSEETGLPVDIADWSVNIVDVLFAKSMFAQRPAFYGTASRFSNWLDWMQMDGMQGNMVFKVTFYRN